MSLGKDRNAGEGSDQAFEEIVRRYRARLVAFAAGIVPGHRAEDIVQESLTRVYSVLRESDSDVHLAPWLFTIVRNRALNAVRDERVHVELDEQFDGVTPPPEILARREEVAALVAGIKALPEAQRQALVGRELEGLSHDEIATRLGTSSTSVRGLIFRARTAVRHAAGAVIPLPAVRWLLAEAPGARAGEVASGGGMAAAGLATASAGGGSVAVKAGAMIAAAALATGANVGLRDSGSGGESSRSGSAQASSGDVGEGGRDQAGLMPGGDLSREGDSASQGPGGGHSGPGRGGGEDRGDDHSGPGGGVRGGQGEGEDHSGPGDGPDDRNDDHSGPGGGDSSGSGSSGSGSSGSRSGGSGSGGGDDGDEPEEPDDD